MCIRDRLAALHLLRQQAKKVANAHRRLQNVTALEAHIADRFIDRLDNGGAGVMAVSYTHLDVYKRQRQYRPVRHN